MGYISTFSILDDLASQNMIFFCSSSDLFTSVRCPIFVLLFGLSLPLLGCQKVQPTYPPDHPSSLQKLVQNWVRDYQGQVDPQQGRARLKQHLKATLLTQSRFKTLFTPSLVKPLGAYYHQTLVPKLIKEAPFVIQDAIGKGMTEVAIRRVGPNVGKYLSPGDLILLENMPTRPALYTVRLHLKDDSLGLRLNAFFYDQGQWKSLYKLGELLESWNLDQLNQLKAAQQ